MLHLHFSNRLEPLADLLVDALQGTRDDPFTPDTLIIPHSAAQRHVALALAARQGVAANLQFSYLARWLWAMVARVLPGVGEESPFDAASLTWRLYALLRDPAFSEPHPPLRDWLARGAQDPVQAFEMAERGAGLLEQYITYRPDWLQRWGAGERALVPGALHEGWQADAWARIAQALEAQGPHPIERMAQALVQAGPQAAARFGLPPVAHVFGLAAIPPLYLQGLQALSGAMDLHVYATNPCREYWFDGVSPRQLDRLALAGREAGREVLHPLLLSWGGQAQAALSLLDGIADTGAAQSHHHFVEDARRTLLARLQSSILDLSPMAPGSFVPQPGDRSLEVHVAHSAMRELEVLQDHLLGLFDADPTLRPSDVLVALPDLEAAAPLVDAVFGTPPAGCAIPYALTGQRRSGVNAPARALLELLSLAASRCTATGVYGLLQQPIVARRFGLDADALDAIHGWILDSGIRWGLDAAHVAAQDLPAGAPHTLADGLSRLFLGHVLPPGAAEPLGDVLACPGPEGSDANALGAFWQFVEALRAFARLLGQARPASAWVSQLHAAVSNFMAPDAAETEDALELHAAIDGWAAALSRAGFDGELPAPVMRAALERAIDDAAHGGAETGRVTFAAMASLRNLPFRVVCVIGLADGAFPTADRPAEFDLMAAAPRLGDRQRRADQRNLFLDLLLAARDSVYLSYTGHSIRDNAALPPSVLVAELMDHVRGAFAKPEDAARLVVSHPLQPFSPAAFDPAADPRLRSHDLALADALREGLAAVAQRRDGLNAWVDGGVGEDADTEAEDSGDEDGAGRGDPQSPFIASPLPPPDEAWRRVPVQRLAEFFGNPSRYLLRRRLALDLPQDAPVLCDEEPFLPDFEGRARLADRLLPHLLEGASPARVERLARAGTELPAGPMGEGELSAELSAMRQFAEVVRDFIAPTPLPPLSATLDFDIEGENWAIDIALADLRPQGLVRWRYDDERPTDVLRAWLHHLALCAWRPDGVAPSTTWVARDGITVYAEVQPGEARRRLRELLAAYRSGLSAPLHFFPKSAWAFAQRQRIADAAKVWEGGTFDGERAKPGHALALRGQPDPLDEAFEALAMAVFSQIPHSRVDFAGSPLKEAA